MLSSFGCIFICHRINNSCRCKPHRFEELRQLACIKMGFAKFHNSKSWYSKELSITNTHGSRKWWWIHNYSGYWEWIQTDRQCTGFELMENFYRSANRPNTRLGRPDISRNLQFIKLHLLLELPLQVSCRRLARNSLSIERSRKKVGS